MRRIIWKAFCRLVTSVVMRVTSPAVENLSMFENEKVCTLQYMASRRLQAYPADALAENRPASTPKPQAEQGQRQHQQTVAVDLAHIAGLDALVDDGGGHKGDQHLHQHFQRRDSGASSASFLYWRTCANKVFIMVVSSRWLVRGCGPGFAASGPGSGQRPPAAPAGCRRNRRRCCRASPCSIFGCTALALAVGAIRFLRSSPRGPGPCPGSRNAAGFSAWRTAPPWTRPAAGAARTRRRRCRRGAKTSSSTTAWALVSPSSARQGRLVCSSARFSCRSRNKCGPLHGPHPSLPAGGRSGLPAPPKKRFAGGSYGCEPSACELYYTDLA